MGYHELTFTIQPSTGYRFKKYFGISGGVSYEPKFIWLPNPDHEQNDPILISDPYLRSTIIKDNWRHRFRVFSTFSIATTKRNINPYEGFKFSLSAAFSFIHYDSIILSTKFTWYWKILDLYFNDWPFKNVLVFNTNFSFIFPGFQYSESDRESDPNEKNYRQFQNFGPEPVLHSSDYQVVDGLFSGRGWANSLAGLNYFNLKVGYAKLDFSIEYRIPIYEQIVWIAGFIDFFNLIEGPKVYVKRGDTTYISSINSWQWWNGTYNYTNKNVKPVNYNPLGIDNWYGSIGFGIE